VSHGRIRGWGIWGELSSTKREKEIEREKERERERERERQTRQRIQHGATELTELHGGKPGRNDSWSGAGAGRVAAGWRV
jgi:hypothetical protein